MDCTNSFSSFKERKWMAKTKSSKAKETDLVKSAGPLHPAPRQYLTTFRPTSQMSEAVSFATEVGATVLYQSETTFAAMVNDHQRQKIDAFMFAN